MIDNKNQSGFYLLSDNTDAFVARLTLATIATKTLDIQYYIIHNDASGQYLAYVIMAAADRGVHVRILVDDINLSGRDSNLKMLSQHDNIEIRIFNPLRNRDWFRNIELLTNLDRAGRRMHNKAFIADNSEAIIGGRNLGDEYFDARLSLNFIDLDLLTTGPIVTDISNSFDVYWNSHWATAIEDLSKVRVFKQQLSNIKSKLKDKWHKAKNTRYFQSIQQSDLTQMIKKQQIPFIWANARFFYDCPEKIGASTPEKTFHIGPQVIPYFNDTKEDLLIATPYFVPGINGLKWLQNKRLQGIEIKVLTNSLAATDVIAVHAGYKKYRKQLLEAGINLFELKPTARHFREKTRIILSGSSNSSLHAKYMVIDRRYVFIGSANIDPRSNNLNTEIGVMVDSKELAEQTATLFNRTTTLDNCHQLSIDKTNNKMFWSTNENGERSKYYREPDVSTLRRIAVFILGLLPIESLL